MIILIVFLIVIFVLFMVFIYSLMVVSGRGSRIEERFWGNKENEEDEKNKNFH